MMSLVNIAKVEAAHRQAQDSGSGWSAPYFKRMLDQAGKRAAIRFDNVAGCLRTPEGGSSRQHVIVIDGGEVRSRLLSPRECARLMGLADTYALPSNANAGRSSDRRRRGRADDQLPGGARP
jgi:DNA (cytosine-5)-methyltransferase 1